MSFELFQSLSQISPDHSRLRGARRMAFIVCDPFAETLRGPSPALELLVVAGFDAAGFGVVLHERGPYLR
jgi:hypothetical protein